MKKQELSEDMIKNIKEYSKSIKTIELFVDSVRQNPGEYLSSTGNEGWFNALREVIQNATDEQDRKKSPCDWVGVWFDERTQGIIVKDNGRGIPEQDVVRVVSREHTSTNFDKAEGEYPSGLHGVGVKCTNAVSSKFKVISSQLGKAYEIEFSEGKPLRKYKDGPKPLSKPELYQGTIVEAIPDFSIMGKTTITCANILELLENIIPLMKLGAHIEFYGVLQDGTGIHKDLRNIDGVVTFLIRRTTKPLIKPIVISYDTGVMKVEIAVTYVADLNRSSDVLTFANKTPVNTMLSTPSKGFFKGITEFFRDYMNQVYLANNKKLETISSDITTGLIGTCAAYHMAVMFDSQAKNVCKNEDLEPFVKDVVKQYLQEWRKNNPEDLAKLCSFFKDVATARFRADKEKSNIGKKYKTNDFTELPDGFVKAERSSNCELFIVEGLSASSPCETSRNSLFQAIYPIRGKMPNVFEKSSKNFLENAEVKDIGMILGGLGKNFKLENCIYDKVIILTDADYDSQNLSF